MSGEKPAAITANATVSLAVVGSVAAFLAFEAYTRGVMETKLDGALQRLARIEAKIDGMKPGSTIRLLASERCIGDGGNYAGGEERSGHGNYPVRYVFHAPHCRVPGLTIR